MIGITAIVASLVFVGLQMRQAQDIAMSDGNLANAANVIEANTAIAENSGIWLRGNSGEKLDENDEIVFQTLARAILIAKFMEIMRLRRVGEDGIADAQTADFSSFLFEHPGVRRTWTDDRRGTVEHRSLLIPGRGVSDDQFAETVISQLEQLDRL